MPTPTITFRVKPGQRSAIREIVSSVKNDSALAAELLGHLRTRPTPVPGAAARNIGPFRDEEAVLSFLVGRLKAALRPEAIFLFGSRASGSARPDSDFDLLVVLPDGGGGQPDWFAAYAPVAGCGVGVDVMPCRVADFEAERNRAGSIAHAADRGGRLLYARPGGAFRDRWRTGAVPE